MVVAYLLLKVEPGSEQGVMQKLMGKPGVIEAELIYGSYDILLKLEFRTTYELDAFIFETVRAIAGVKDTLTLMTARPRILPEFVR
ncbi:Lrp/AsnC ligand binding domain-containing protein [Candidatus Bathyarchaeota archaeon]|nr:Lrp/AsnC ligand binding domain-containing protein [Candidatus Bathyarchaeota archaeon]